MKRDYAMCAACETDLSSEPVISKAEGILYCSDECGIHDFKNAYGVLAEEAFLHVVTRHTPQELGIMRTYEEGLKDEA